MKLHNLLILFLFSCAERPSLWTQALPSIIPFIGMEKHVAVIDGNADRVLFLSVGADNELTRQSLSVGQNVISSQKSPDGKRLFVLSRGTDIDDARGFERPSVTLLDGTQSRRFELESPHSGISIDPEGRWVALFSMSNQVEFIENPNELVLIDLEAPAESAILTRTLRSFGGRPQRISFTRALSLPGGARRLLVVETEQDVILLDLQSLQQTTPRPEISVRLSNSSTQRPLAFVIDEGDAGNETDTRMAIRLQKSSSVVVLTFVARDSNIVPPAGQELNNFTVDVNLVDVGGDVSSFDFVKTGAGVRLLATVPSQNSVAMIDPTSGLLTNIAMPAKYTDLQKATDSSWILYSQTGTTSVGILSIEQALAQPFQSIEIVTLPAPVTGVLSVPEKPELKVLFTNSNVFYILNLQTKTAAPMTTQQKARLLVSTTGKLIWAFQPGTSNAFYVDTDSLHPTQLLLPNKVDEVFEVPNAAGGTSMIALSPKEAVRAVIVDGKKPDATKARHYRALMLEELP